LKCPSSPPVTPGHQNFTHDWRNLSGMVPLALLLFAAAAWLAFWAHDNCHRSVAFQALTVPNGLMPPRGKIVKLSMKRCIVI